MPSNVIGVPVLRVLPLFFFFFNDTATTEIYTLSLHDALPICEAHGRRAQHCRREVEMAGYDAGRGREVIALLRFRDRKSTRLNSSHANISYAVFCLKKKTQRSRRYTTASIACARFTSRQSTVL